MREEIETDFFIVISDDEPRLMTMAFDLVSFVVRWDSLSIKAYN